MSDIQRNNEELSKDEKESKVPDELHIPEELRSIFENLKIPDDKKREILKVIKVSVLRSSSFIGPIPPPDILKGYNDVVKDGAERILVMAEKQSNHRIQLEDFAIKEELKQSRLGQLFGFILGSTGLSLATVLALLGHETIAGIFGTTTIGSLVAVFVLGKKAQKKDLDSKE